MRKASANRMLTFVLSFLLAFSTLPVQALAEVVEEVVPQEEVSEPLEVKGLADPAAVEGAMELEAQLSAPEAVIELEAYTPGDDGASSEVLATLYAEQQLLAVLPEDASAGEPPLVRSSGYNLSTYERRVLDQLKPMVSAVAAGERSSTVFDIDTVEVFGQEYWTADDLGVDYIWDDNGRFNPDATQAFESATTLNEESVIDVLLADCPFELYWYQKTESTYFPRSYGGTFDDNGEQAMCFTGNKISFYLPVDTAYATGEQTAVPGSDPVVYMLATVSTLNGQRVNGAVANAQLVVSGASGTPYEMLEYFKQQICDRVEYDHDAADGNADDGDPWQIINVFDDDENTNVVCEGYSKAFKYLCDLAGISGVDCILASGTMSGGTGEGPHMWNIVNMDDGYNYLVDVTNCDEGSIGNPDLLFMVPPASGEIEEGYAFTCDGESISYAYDSDTRSTFTDADLTLSGTPYEAPDIPAGGRYFADAEGNRYLYFPLTIESGEGISAFPYQEIGTEWSAGDQIISVNGQTWFRPDSESFELTLVPTVNGFDVGAVSVSYEGASEIETTQLNIMYWTDQSATIDGNEYVFTVPVYQVPAMYSPMTVTVESVDLSDPITYWDQDGADHECYRITFPTEDVWAYTLNRESGDSYAELAGNTLTFEREGIINNRYFMYFASDTGSRFSLQTQGLKTIDSVSYSVNGGEAIELLPLEGLTYDGNPIYEVPPVSGSVVVEASIGNAYTIDQTGTLHADDGRTAYLLSYHPESNAPIMFNIQSAESGDSWPVVERVDNEATNGQDFYLWSGVLNYAYLGIDDGAAVETVSLIPTDAGTVDLAADGRTVKVMLEQPAELQIATMPAPILRSGSNVLAFDADTWQRVHGFHLATEESEWDVYELAIARIHAIDDSYETSWPFAVHLYGDDGRVDLSEAGLEDVQATFSMVTSAQCDPSEIKLFLYDANTDTLTPVDATAVINNSFDSNGWSFSNYVITTDETLGTLDSNFIIAAMPGSSNPGGGNILYGDAYELHYPDEFSPLFSQLSLNVHNYFSDDPVDESVWDIEETCYDASGLDGSLFTYRLERLWLENADGAEITDLEAAGLADVSVTMRTDVGGANDPERIAIVHYDRATGVATKLNITDITASETYVSEETGEEYFFWQITYECTAAETMGDICVMSTTKSGDPSGEEVMYDDNGNPHVFYQLNIVEDEDLSVVLPENGRIDGEDYDYHLNGVPRFTEYYSDGWKYKFDSTRDIIFYIRSTGYYIVDSVTYSVDGGAPVAIEPNGQVYSEYYPDDAFSLYSIPAVEGEVTISTHGHELTYTVNPDGTISFESGIYPDANLLSFDMPAGASFDYCEKADGAERAPFGVPSSTSAWSGGTDYYCWPGFASTFVFRIPNDQVIDAAVLEPANAGTVNVIDRYGTVEITLDSPATLVVTTVDETYSRVDTDESTGITVAISDYELEKIDGLHLVTERVTDEEEIDTSRARVDLAENGMWGGNFPVDQIEVYDVYYADAQGNRSDVGYQAGGFLSYNALFTVPVPDGWTASNTHVWMLGSYQDDGGYDNSYAYRGNATPSIDGSRLSFKEKTLGRVVLVRDVYEYKNSISDAQIEPIPDQLYTGSSIEPELSISFNGSDLVLGTDYTVTYSNNLNTGNATATVVGSGSWLDYVEVNFKIVPRDGLVAAGMWGTCPWEIAPNGTLTVHPGEGVPTEEFTYRSPWYRYGHLIGSIVFLEEDGQRVIAPYDCSYLFGGLEKLAAIDLSGLDISSASMMNGLFQNCSSLRSLNLSDWDTSSVVNMENMFFGCTSLESIVVGAGWSTPSEGDQSWMFSDCTSLVGGDGTVFDPEHIDGEYARIDMEGVPGYFTSAEQANNSLALAEIASIPNQSFCGAAIEPKVTVTLDGNELVEGRDYEVSYQKNVNTGIATITVSGIGGFVGSKGAAFRIDAPDGFLEAGLWGTCPWEIAKDGVLTVHPGTGAESDGSYSSPWIDYAASITSVVLREEGGKKIIAPADASGLFSYLSEAKTVDLSGFDTSHTTNMSGLFSGCGITELDVSTLDTSLVTDMSSMFGMCRGLRSVDVSGFDTSSVTTMEGMFGASGIVFLDLSSFDTANVTSLGNMFDNCHALRMVDLSSFDTSSVTSMTAMFLACRSLVTVYAGDAWTTENVTELEGGMFAGATSIVGGNGTTYSYRHVELEYARIDAPGTPGYFTAKPAGKADVTDADVAIIPSQTYTGSAIEPEVTVTYNGDTLAINTDYTVTYSNNTIVGTATVTITGTGDYTGSQSTYFSILPAPIGSVDIPVSITTLYEPGTDPLPVPFGLTFNGKSLIEGTDYSVSFGEIDFSGSIPTSVATITGSGNFDGGATLKVYITPYEVQAEEVEFLEICEQIYTGQPLKPEVSFTVSNVTVPDEYYSVTYENNVDVGKGTAIVTFNGLYAGSIRIPFEIVEPPAVLIDIADAEISGLPEVVTWTGESLKPDFTITLNDVVLKKDIDYTVEYGDSVSEADCSCTVTVTGIGTYTGTLQTSFFIDRASITDAEITLSDNSFRYTGDAIEPEVTVVWNGRTLIKDADYTVSYRNNVDVGGAYVDIQGIGNFKGTSSATFSIYFPSLSVDTIAPQVFTGFAIEPEVNVTCDGATLVKGVDYTTAFENNVYSGTAKVTITGIGGYAQAEPIWATFWIDAASIVDCDVDLFTDRYDDDGNPVFDYTGEQIRPSNIKVMLGEYVLTEGTDYTVEYGENISDIGFVTLRGQGNFAGSKSLSFIIDGGETPPDPGDENVLYAIEANAYELHFSEDDADKFEGATLHFAYNEDFMYDYDSEAVQALLKACEHASGLSGFTFSETVFELWLEDAAGNRIDVANSELADVQVTFVPNTGANYNAQSYAFVRYDGAANVATKLPQTVSDDGNLRIAVSASEILGEIAEMATTDHVVQYRDDVEYDYYKVSTITDGVTSVEFTHRDDSGALPRHIWASEFAMDEAVTCFDATRGAEFFVKLPEGYRLDEVAYTTRSGATATLQPTGNTYTDWMDGKDYDVYETPAVAEPITITVSTRATFSIDDGVATFEDGSKAYRLDFDLPAGVSVMRMQPSNDSYRQPFIDFDGNLYCWPDAFSMFGVLVPNEYGLVESALNPAGAGTVSWITTADIFEISLTAPATMRLEIQKIEYVPADEDAATGIAVDVPENIVGEYEAIDLVVEEKTGEPLEEAKLVIEQYEGDYGFSPDDAVLFDIHYEDESGEEVPAPSSAAGALMKVTLPVPDGWDASKVRVYYIDTFVDSDGETITYPLDMGATPTADGRAVVFYTMHFSDYAMAYDADADPAKVDLSTAVIAPIPDKAYTGEAIEPEPDEIIVTLDGLRLVETVDYTVTFRDNVKPGTATVIVEGAGNYSGTVSSTFEIVSDEPQPTDISVATIAPIPDQEYTGSAITPAITVTLDGSTLNPDNDYTVEYKYNTAVGTAVVIVKGSGAYAGEAKSTFKIVEPAGPFFLDADPADDANHGAEVDWMGRSGISAGWEVAGGREFRGLQTVKRCDFAAFLYRMADLSDDGTRNDSIALSPTEVSSVLSNVRDCTPSTDHAPEIAWLISTGISRGWQNSDGTVSFKPYANVARQDMAAFLYRFADLDDDGVQNHSPEMGPQTVTFSDVRHGDEANHASEVEWLASVGVTKGWDMGNGTYEFRGTRNVARQDMAAFMYRLYAYLQQQG